MRFAFAPSWTTILVASTLSLPSFAAVEKVAVACGEKVCFHWWPKLSEVKGWRHDRDHSLHYNFNALVPATASFATAETVMYANAIYRPRVPDEQTLTTFIESDMKKFRDQSPGVKTEETTPLTTADGKVARSFLLQPRTNGQWERVAYLEEGDYYMVFVVSSRNHSGLQRANSAYEELVSHYRE